MSIAEDLDYAFPEPNRLQRAVQALVSTRPGSWVLSRALPALDRAAARLTGGRTSVSELGAGVPIVVLITMGRKSGLPRESLLVGFPLGDAMAVIGSNYGQGATPAWVLNLEAENRASLAHEAKRIDVVARPATETEGAKVLSLAATVYGGYTKYLARISGRRVRIFVLESR